MESNQQTVPQHPFIAGFWLIAAIPASILIILPFVTIFKLDIEETGSLYIAALIHFVAGYLWARSLGRRTGRPDSQMMNIAAGIGFTFFVWGGRAAFNEFESTLEQWFKPFQGITHLEFGAIFVLWTGLVTGGTGLMLGLGAMDWKLGLKLLVSGFLSGGGIFLLVAFFMDLLGFRVGTPRADGLPSMVITTFLGIWCAALVGSAIFGKMLAKLETMLET